MTTVKNMRIKAGLKQGEAAKRAGVTPAHLCQIEAGKAGVSVAVSKRLGRIYDAKWHDIMEAVENDRIRTQA